MLDQVLTGSLCFLALAIYMYIKFIRRERAGFEQVAPTKEAKSPPSRDASTDLFDQTHDHNSPPLRKPNGQYVFQHPMRRRTHSSMTVNTELIPPPPDMLIAIEQAIPEETPFFTKSPGPTRTHEAKPPPFPRKVTSPNTDVRLFSPKKKTALSSPDVDLFADISSDKNSIAHLESQRQVDERHENDQQTLDIVLDMPKTNDMNLHIDEPPLHPPILNPTPRAKLLLDDHRQPAQMQLEVARKAHIPLFLHMPLHPRKDEAAAAVGSPPPPVDPILQKPQAAHVVKRPGHAQGFNFRINFSEITMGELIGQGAFGTVHKGIWRGTVVAIKILQVQHLSPDVLEEFETEVHIMSVLRHPNICLLMGACLDPPTRCLVVEYIPKGSLWCVLRQPSISIDLKKQLSFALDTALGMHYLHTFDPPILHRDLKSPNLLVDGSYRIKISDFGLARVKAHHQTMTGNCGTTQWMAPEVLAAEKYTEKADVFSFGVVCWETVTHACPYDGLSQIQAALGVLNHNLRPTIPPNCPPFLKKLMTVCWGPVPEKRPTFAQVIDMLQGHQYQPPMQ